MSEHSHDESPSLFNCHLPISFAQRIVVEAGEDVPFLERRSEPLKEFILRLPLDGKIFEFPFKLPPKPGEVLLRKRE